MAEFKLGLPFSLGIVFVLGLIFFIMTFLDKYPIIQNIFLGLIFFVIFTCFVGSLVKVLSSDENGF